MDTKLQDRYFRVRRELSGLNYSGNFGVDALDIVEQLFSDLVSTTESYSHMQEKEHQLSQNLALAQAQVFPLRKENAKLLRENQQLHAEVVSLKEDATNRNDSLSQKIRKLTEELEDVKYLCQSKDSEITKLEKERLRIKEAYENLASSSLLSGGVKVKRGIKLSSPAAFATETDGPDISQANTDGNIIETLRRQVEHLEASLKTATAELESTKDSLFRKDQELLKLSTTKLSLSGSIPQLGRGERAEPTDQMEYLLGANRANQRIIDQLNTKVGCLFYFCRHRHADQLG
jgi:centrosomal protein CEP135